MKGCTEADLIRNENVHVLQIFYPTEKIARCEEQWLAHISKMLARI
jgi:hypothetical protein